MLPHLAQVADIADVIALSILIDVFELHFLAAQLGGPVKSLQDRAAIARPPPML
jgi:hypothetical protein